MGETPGLTAYEIAGRMRWSIRCRSWEDFPLTQKSSPWGRPWPNLDYLEVRGRVCRREIRGKRVYFAGAGDQNIKDTKEMLSMDVKEILSKCDHTLLAQTATWKEIQAICDDG